MRFTFLSRQAQLTDAMVDLLVETVHKIGSRSKPNVIGEIAKGIERNYSKEKLPVDIAVASIHEPATGLRCYLPDRWPREASAIIKESQAKGALDRRIYNVMPAQSFNTD